MILHRLGTSTEQMRFYIVMSASDGHFAVTIPPKEQIESIEVDEIRRVLSGGLIHSSRELSITVLENAVCFTCDKASPVIPKAACPGVLSRKWDRRKHLVHIA
ncbi:MAG: hypothetical protein HKN72_11780 [Gemmatimonadetes bacterium]|nr:hypothetical protein [Gemmatimonadota bacterium]NNF13899.1 hypothetical protein [Gemmatimonadota bacterium]